MSFDVTAIGELLIDFACVSTDGDGYPTLSAHPGGAPANLLATVQKLGGRTALLTKVGRDAFGQLLLDTLDGLGIERRGVVVDADVFTTLAFVTLDRHGERTFSFARKPGADTRLTPEEVDWPLIDDSRVLHFGTLSLTDEPARSATRRAVAYAKERGKRITFDPNLRKPLWDSLERAREEMLWGLAQADLVKLSDDEARFLFGPLPYEEAARLILAEYGPKLVFLTLGKEGCLYASRQAEGHVPGLSGLTTVDATGAGDIFGGSVLWKLLGYEKPFQALTGDELEQAARFACACAGLSTTRPGAISSIPAEDEIRAALRR